MDAKYSIAILLWTPPNGEKVVAMCNFCDRLIVATDAGIYERVGDEFRRIKFVQE